MNRRHIALAAGSLLVLAALVAAAIYAAPYWTVHQLREAARERDVEALLARVDQKALRQSVRLALGFRMADSTTPAAGSQDMVRATLDPLTETLSSSTALIAMLREGRPSRVFTRHAAPEPPTPEQAAGQWDAQLRYRDRSTVDVRAKQAPAAGGFILRRAGLFDWKLSAIETPAD